LRSSALVDALCEGGLSKPAAYKQVQRARHPVCCLEHLHFGRRDRLYFLDSHDASARWGGLKSAARDSNSTFHLGLETLDALGGAVEERRFAIISGVEQGRLRRRSADGLAGDLMRDGVLERVNVSGRGAYLARPEAYGGVTSIEARLAARGVVEDLLRGALFEHFAHHPLATAG